MSIEGWASIHIAAHPGSAERPLQAGRETAAPDLTGPEHLAPERRAELERAVEKLNHSPEMRQYDLKFEIVDKSRIVIRVVNQATGEILRRIPAGRSAARLSVAR